LRLAWVFLNQSSSYTIQTNLLKERFRLAQAWEFCRAGLTYGRDIALFFSGPQGKLDFPKGTE
jgi:hypothetical protein